MVDRPTLLMTIAFVAGGALLAYELQREPTLPPPPDAQTAAAVTPLELPPNEIRSLAAYEAISERPLFSPQRRPQTVDAGPAGTSAQAQATENIDGFRLTAVLKGAGSNTALVEDESGKTRSVHQGERLGKWQVQEILDDRIVVMLDAQRKTLLVHRFDPVQSKQTIRRRPNQSASRRTLPQSRRIPSVVRNAAGARTQTQRPDNP